MAARTEHFVVAMPGDPLHALRAAIDYALEIEDGLEWLRCWRDGDDQAMAELNRHLQETANA